MHNYNVNTYLLPRKLALPSLGGVGGGYAGSGSPSLGGAGGGYASKRSPPLGRGWGWVSIKFFYKCFRRKGRAEKRKRCGRKYASFEPCW